MILLVGLDGYDWRWAEYLVRAGYSVAPLYSPVPLSWVAWNTIGTGVDASSWGASDNPVDYLEFSRERIPRPPYLWERMAESGQAALVVNWPFVLTPQPFYGTLVCGYPAPETHYVIPADQAGCWDYQELDLSARWMEASEEEKVRLLALPPHEHLRRCAVLRNRLALRVIEQAQRTAPALVVLGIMSCDRLSHYANAGMLDEQFRAELLVGLTETVGMVEQALRPECTILFSDHGLDLEAPARTGGSGYTTHAIELPDSMTGVLALKRSGYKLPTMTAQQIDVAPMVLNRVGISHDLTGTDRSVRTGD
jgi:hypothetical protein